ncbi:MAG: hypothetical protein PHI63_02475 [Patescibacteria group bacterium]|nr:hypothetical protein [Patescibacteria group bacterium]
MKKNIVIIGALTLIVVLSYWYLKNPPRAHPSKGGEVCLEKCRAILRENLTKCGDDCLTGAPFFAYDKVTGKCLSKVLIAKSNYQDLYVNDCNTNQYISRWNPTQEELAKLSKEKIGESQLEVITSQDKLLGNLIDLRSNNLPSDKVEGFLFGP